MDEDIYDAVLDYRKNHPEFNADLYFLDAIRAAKTYILLTDAGYNTHISSTSKGIIWVRTNFKIKSK